MVEHIQDRDVTSGYGTGPTLTRWNTPALPCPGCAGCAIQTALNERQAFSRAEVSHLIALAFRSGTQLAWEMAGDITRWAAQPQVARTARESYERRLAELEVGAERQAFRRATSPHRPFADLTETDWPEVAVPGGRI